MEYGLLLVWLVAYLAFLAIGMPLAATVFPSLADRGAGVALPLALAVLWVVAYLVGHLSLTVGLWVGLLVLVALAAVAVSRGATIDRRRYAEIAAVFSIAFLFMVGLRALDPGIHPYAGEKFLDFGLLKSVIRADVLPPEDMWFAGRPVKYYYGGHLLAGLLARITGTEGRFAYNLALAGFFGMLVTAAYGIAGSLAASRGLSRVRAGAFGAFFVGFASNVTTPGRFLVWLLPEGISQTIAGALGFEIKRLAASGPAGFHYWTASRVIDGTINEFPLFAWLNGDLHAHMMSTPFVLLTAALLFAYFRTPESAVWRRRALVFGLVPPLAGLLVVVNTWSFPTVGGLTFLALGLASASPVSLLPKPLAEAVRRETLLGQEVSRYGLALAAAVVVVVLGVVWSLPFWLGTASTRSIGFLPDKSSMGELLGVHGAFVLVFGIYLLRHALPRIDRDNAPEIALLLALIVFVAWGTLSAPALALFGPMILVGWILLRTQADALDRAATATTDAVRGAVSDGGGAVTDATPEMPVERLRNTVGFETVLLIAGAGIVVLVEFVYVKEQAGPGRLNTVFKTYMDVWILWGVAAGAVVTHLFENFSPRLALTSGRWRTGTRALVVVLVIGLSLYGAFAVVDQAQSFGNQADNPGFTNGRIGELTLDGLAYVAVEHPDEAKAIHWFDSLSGQPNMVSAPGRPMYQWSSPVASLTGIPTLAGWHHEVGYRGRDPYFTRVEDVQTIYTGPLAERAYLLDVYEVEYVYVGSNEREKYAASDLRRLAEMAGVNLIRQWGDVRVYAVDQEQLSYPGKSGKLSPSGKSG